MSIFGITFVAAEPSVSIEEIGEAFYDKFDGMLSRSAGRILIAAYSDGTDGPATAIQLVNDLELVLHVTIESVDLDLVDIGEIAGRTSRSRQNIRQFVTGERGPGGFPMPLGSPGGKRIWDWPSVQKWLCEHSYINEEERLLTFDESSLVNVWLAARKRWHIVGVAAEAPSLPTRESLEILHTRRRRHGFRASTEPLIMVSAHRGHPVFLEGTGHAAAERRTHHD